MEPLFEYRPLRASPILTALLLVLAAATLSAIALPATTRGLYPPAHLALPTLLLALLMLLATPGPLRIYPDRLELPRPLALRLLGARTIPYTQVENLYPCLYDLGGGFMSPFASAHGSLTLRGIMVETQGGRRYLARFTPLVFPGAPAPPEAYHQALRVLREQFQSRGRPLVSRPPAYTPEQAHRMEEETRGKLLPFTLIALSGFSAPLVLSTGMALLLHTGQAAESLPAALLALASTTPFLAVLSLSWRRSTRRHHLLNELAKHYEIFSEGKNFRG